TLSFYKLNGGGYLSEPGQSKPFIFAVFVVKIIKIKEISFLWKSPCSLPALPTVRQAAGRLNG
ncbi:MAG: hypothetical protein COV84_04490, partial [Candidatus Portnoybacteria bacterium CG11_big_fil_rev_8_21_14_0_20_40_15]